MVICSCCGKRIRDSKTQNALYKYHNVVDKGYGFCISCAKWVMERDKHDEYLIKYFRANQERYNWS